MKLGALKTLVSQNWRRGGALQIVRYGIVGVGVIGLEYAIYVVELRFHAQPLLAHVAARILAGSVGYFAHAYLTFGQSNAHGRRVPRYVFLLLFNTMLSSALLAGALTVMGPLAGKVAADATCALISYGFARRFVFRAELADPVGTPPPINTRGYPMDGPPPRNRGT